MAASDDIAKLTEENRRLRAQVASFRDGGGARPRTRTIATAVLVVLTSLSVLAATTGVWIERTLWDPDRFVALLAPLADDPAVTDALAVRVTADTFEALDVQARVGSALTQIPQLPEGAGALLAGPLTAAARGVVEDQVKAFLASDAFATLWNEIVGRAHIKAVALLNGDLEELPNLSVEDGEVQLNLVSVVAEVLRRVAQSGADGLGLDVAVPDIPVGLTSPEAIARLGQALGVPLPPDFGQVTVMTADELAGYQQAAHRLERLSGGLILASGVLLALTIAVSPRRRRTLIWLGAGVATAFFLGGIAIRRIQARVLDAIAAPGGRAAARDVFAEAANGLRRLGVVVLIVALAVALAAYLAGRPPWVRRALEHARALTAPRPGGSRLDVWLTTRADAVRVGGAAIACVALFVTGIDWIPVAIVALLYGGLLWAVAASVRRTHGAAGS